MEPAAVGRDEGGMRKLERKIENTGDTGQPTEVGLVAHDDGIVAALFHKGTDALDTARGAGGKL